MGEDAHLPLLTLGETAFYVAQRGLCSPLV